MRTEYEQSDLSTRATKAIVQMSNDQRNEDDLPGILAL